MTTEQPKQAGSNSMTAHDVSYLRDDQYRTPDRLNARILLHSKYGVSKIDWFEWIHSSIEWDSVQNVLEVGCGTGLLWSSLPDTVKGNLQLTLTDLSPSMVEVSLLHARKQLENVQSLEANVQNLPFETASFDLVVANQMLYHVPDPSLALAEVSRVLKPGGTLIASTVGPLHLLELFEIEALVFGVRRDRSHADVFGSQNGREMLERKFVDIEWRQFEDALRCTNLADVVAYLTSVPPGETANSEELRQLRVEVEHRMHESAGVLEVTKDSGLFLARHPR